MFYFQLKKIEIIITINNIIDMVNHQYSKNNKNKNYRDRKKRNYINRKKKRKLKTKLNYSILDNDSINLYKYVKYYDFFVDSYFCGTFDWEDIHYYVIKEVIDISNYKISNNSINDLIELMPSYGVSFSLDNKSVLNILPELKNLVVDNYKIIHNGISPVSTKSELSYVIFENKKQKITYLIKNLLSKNGINSKDINYKVIDKNSRKEHELSFKNEFSRSNYTYGFYKLILCICSDNKDVMIGSDEIFDIKDNNYRRKIYPTGIEGNSVCLYSDIIHKKNSFNNKNIIKIEVLFEMVCDDIRVYFGSLYHYNYKIYREYNYDNYLNDKKYNNYLEKRLRRNIFFSNKGPKIYLPNSIIRIIHSYLNGEDDKILDSDSFFDCAMDNNNLGYIYDNWRNLDMTKYENIISCRRYRDYEYFKNKLMYGKENGLYYIMLEDEKKIIEYTYENYYKLLN